KRDGYSFNQLTNSPIDGRDLWSTRVSVAWRPVESLSATLVWEHFSENDDRMRTAKQLCKTDPLPTSVNGAPTGLGTLDLQSSTASHIYANYLSQSCLPTGLYSSDAFE